MTIAPVSPVSAAQTPSSYTPPPMVSALPAMVVGTVRTAGPLGGNYEVIGPVRPLHGGDWMMSVHKLSRSDVSSDTGEYRLSDIVRHPRA